MNFRTTEYLEQTEKFLYFDWIGTPFKVVLNTQLENQISIN